MNHSSVAAPDPSLAKDALRRIFESSCLQEASLPGKVLAHVVERTLAGDSRSIKAYTIAVEALGRGSDFDPDRDSTVRVAAMRLRGALDLYYAGPGAGDPMKIRLVPGSYRPSFELAGDMDDAETTAGPQPSFQGGLATPPAAMDGTGRRSRQAGSATRWWLAAVTVALTIDILVTASLLAAQVSSRSSEPAAAVAVSRMQDPAERKLALFTLITDGIERSFSNVDR